MFIPSIKKDKVSKKVKVFSNTIGALTDEAKVKSIVSNNFQLLTSSIIDDNLQVFESLIGALQKTIKGKEELKKFLTSHEVEDIKYYYLTVAAKGCSEEFCQYIVKLIRDTGIGLKKILEDPDCIAFNHFVDQGKYQIICDAIGKESAISLLSAAALEDKELTSPIIKSCCDTESWKLLFDNLRDIFYASNYTNKLPLSLLIEGIKAAFSYDKKDLIEYILKDKEVKSRIDMKTFRDCFWISCTHGSIKSLKYIVENIFKNDKDLLDYCLKTNLDEESDGYYDFYKPLHETIQGGKLEVVKYLTTLIKSKKLLTKTELKKIISYEGEETIDVTLYNNKDGNNKHLNVVLHLITEDLVSEKDIDSCEPDSYEPFVKKFVSLQSTQKTDFSLVPNFKELLEFVLTSKTLFEKTNLVKINGDFLKLITPDSEYFLKILTYLSGGDEKSVKDNVKLILYGLDANNYQFESDDDVSLSGEDEN